MKKRQNYIKNIVTFFLVLVLFSFVTSSADSSSSFDKSDFEDKVKDFKVKDFSDVLDTKKIKLNTGPKFIFSSDALFVDSVSGSFVSAEAVLLKINPVSAIFFCSDPFFIKDCLNGWQFLEVAL